MKTVRLILLIGFLQNSEINFASRERVALIFDVDPKKDEGFYDQMFRAFCAMNTFKTMLQADKVDRPEIKNSLELLEYKHRHIFSVIHVFCNEFDLFLKNSDREHLVSQYQFFERFFIRCCQNQAEILEEYRRICARINIADLD